MEYKGKSNIATALYIIGGLIICGSSMFGCGQKDADTQIRIFAIISGVITGMAIIGIGAIIDLLIVLIDEVRNK
ncbi:MAG: hypothetical protein LBL04_14005 [Bacteroidales bacterium]|jgi:hypothetical protein|nr:hypothetical protein [Bacteroidales bacterium]